MAVNKGAALGAAALQQGAKYDTDKTRLELFPGDALFAISDILTFGAKKYADRNWEKGIAWGRVYGALMRHLWAWWQGKGPTNANFLFGELDAETGRSHLWHAGCCLVFLISYEVRGMTAFDDRPTRVQQEPPVFTVRTYDNSRAEQMDPTPISPEQPT